jgi:NADH-quinone oxidoreductase subunit L
LVYLAGLVTVVLTAAYTTRMVVRTFLGSRRDDATLDPHESPLSMAVPLVILAVPSAGFGVLAAHRFLPSWLPAPVAHSTGIVVSAGPLLLTLALVVVAALAVVVPVRGDLDRDPALLFPAKLRGGFVSGLGVDALYRLGVVRPTMALGEALLVIDRDVVDGTVNASGRTARWAGGVVKLSQSGNVQAYATLMLLGVAVIAVVVAVP